jgi:molybdate transport system substrate-binding protein
VIYPGVLLLLALSLSSIAEADERLTIAVASNFRNTAEQIADAFTKETGVSVSLSSGSTGKLYAQIVNGAPYDIFLAADMARPRLLQESGEATAGSLQAFADGRLVLVSADPALEGRDCLKTLSQGSFRKLAIANPATAPYGAAAKAYLQEAGLWVDAMPRIVMGENISQTFQFVATGNATLGIVAASQLLAEYTPVEIVCRSRINFTKTDMLRQGAVILRRTNNPDAAQSFMTFLRSASAVALIVSHGYEVPLH